MLFFCRSKIPFFNLPYIGTSRRTCLDNGVWDYPDYSQCPTKEFNQLKEKVCILTNSRFFVINDINERHFVTER